MVCRSHLTGSEHGSSAVTKAETATFADRDASIGVGDAVRSPLCWIASRSSVELS